MARRSNLRSLAADQNQQAYYHLLSREGTPESRKAFLDYLARSTQRLWPRLAPTGKQPRPQASHG